MARYKVLKSVAHNLAHSFASDVSWVDGDYALGHLLRRAVATGQSEVSVDLMSGDVRPPGFGETAGGRYLEQMSAWFRDWLVPVNDTSLDYIIAAQMVIDFDLASLAPAHKPWLRQSPEALEPGCSYRISVSITDDRGREWGAMLTGTQYPLLQPPQGEPVWR
jgi:hypothetical protein